MLSAAQLTAFQAASTRSLDLLAKVERDTSAALAQDGKGHKAGNWTTIYTARPCALSEPTTKDYQLYADLIAGQRAWLVSFANGDDVRPNDKLTINSQVMRVQVDASFGSYAVLTQVIATQKGS